MIIKMSVVKGGTQIHFNDKWYLIHHNRDLNDDFNYAIKSTTITGI